MRNPLKERKRFRPSPKALPSVPKNGDASTLNVLSPIASPCSSKNDYLDLSGKFCFMEFPSFFFQNLRFQHIIIFFFFEFLLTTSNNGQER